MGPAGFNGVYERDEYVRERNHRHDYFLHKLYRLPDHYCDLFLKAPRTPPVTALIREAVAGHYNAH